MISMFNFFLYFSFCLLSINGHGYLYQPIARSSAWLIDPSFKTCCTYPSHMEMFCGGVGHQWNTNGGKCGICGEPYDRADKLFEKGGRMYLGNIVETYTQGAQIDVKIKLSANHQGYFEFRLCSLDGNPNSDATQECLDRHLLTIADVNSTQYRDITKHGSEIITLRVQLSPDLTCEHCVFQWKYTTGNNWGRDPVTNKSGPGLGRENETFMGCSDIRILPNQTTTTRPPVIFISQTTIRRKKPSRSRYPIRLPKHWSLLLTIIMPLLSSTTTPIATTTTAITIPRSTTTTIIIPLSIARLSPWSALLIAYQRGDEVIYKGLKYRCTASHRSYAGAEPGPLTWALWQKIL